MIYKMFSYKKVNLHQCVLWQFSVYSNQVLGTLEIQICQTCYSNISGSLLSN